jgi:hypothetical protein
LFFTLGAEHTEPFAINLYATKHARVALRTCQKLKQDTSSRPEVLLLWSPLTAPKPFAGQIDIFIFAVDTA